MRINYNVSAMLTNNNLANNDNLLAKSLQRLSSGLKINAAKDNPAGLAMAKRMNSQLESLAVATQSAGDGVSVIETADGALAEISDMLQRMNELAIKAANGIESENDRQIIQAEVKQLTQEIERVAEALDIYVKVRKSKRIIRIRESLLFHGICQIQGHLKSVCPLDRHQIILHTCGAPLGEAALLQIRRIHRYHISGNQILLYRQTA